ncbi:hypothetical protein L228DRAFT_253696 [Xylona heveae TC161]|uniref:L-tryptophan decarboxylase PsiD-like domain-containing protein n=1 Tax=Xylona heveae (strain CBS 132557 / TC161) TaxID=1328760 RepID=A0A165FPT4_XYLHT|nr:hypothetical protein L228DRAFT_253696 [Xylona heveae TC161]KZF21238.1 hypothetical protein L228DRAFT_253696 [Xylona heveae TC161]
MSTKPVVVPRLGHWLPDNHLIVHGWLKDLIKHVDSKNWSFKDLNPVLQDFQEFIDTHPLARQAATFMFQQVPDKPPYNEDPLGKPQVRDYPHMFQLFNEIIQRAPEWSAHANDVGLIGFPINAILDWPMGTWPGYYFFQFPKINEYFKLMLNEWAKFLASRDSAYILGTDANQWFCPEAIKALEEKGNKVSTQETHYTFEQLYKCNPKDMHYGFKSWDDFFTRRFHPDVRPIEGEENENVIVNGCESAPWRLSTNVKANDLFWLKGQPYSLMDMLNNDDLAPQFVDGTVYQAFLSATSYHRWHSPVNGTVKKIVMVPGTYYCENIFQGFEDQEGPDPAAPDRSQGFISQVATRSIIYIEAENKDIGLMAIVHIGMAEVSSCEYTVKEGDTLKKGQDIGMFHFGGSTHCVLFRPNVDLKFQYPGPYDNWDKGNIPVNSVLAVIPKA